MGSGAFFARLAPKKAPDPIFLFCFATVSWVTVLAVLPVVLAHKTSVDGPVTAAALGYVLAGHVCHQRPDRSFRYREVAFPVCGRCFGLYAGAPLGALLGYVGVRPGRRAAGRRRTSMASWRAVLALAAVPTILTLIVEYSRVGDPGTLLRSAAAVPLGAAVAWLVGSTIGSNPEVDW